MHKSVVNFNLFYPVSGANSIVFDNYNYDELSSYLDPTFAELHELDFNLTPGFTFSLLTSLLLVNSFVFAWYQALQQCIAVNVHWCICIFSAVPFWRLRFLNRIFSWDRVQILLFMALALVNEMENLFDLTNKLIELTLSPCKEIGLKATRQYGEGTYAYSKSTDQHHPIRGVIESIYLRSAMQCSSSVVILILNAFIGRT